MEEKKGKNTKDLISWPRTSYSPISLWKGQVNWLLNMIAYKITYQIELIILSCPIGFQRNERLVFRIETNGWNLVMDTCFVNNIEQVPMKCLIFLCVWKRIQTEFVSHKLQVKWQKLINLENIYLENLDCSCLPSIKKKRIFLFRQQFNKEKNILIPEVKVREFWTILMSPLIYSLYSILVKVIFIGCLIIAAYTTWKICVSVFCYKKSQEKLRQRFHRHFKRQFDFPFQQMKKMNQF